MCEVIKLSLTYCSQILTGESLSRRALTPSVKLIQYSFTFSDVFFN